MKNKKRLLKTVGISISILLPTIFTAIFLFYDREKPIIRNELLTDAIFAPIINTTPPPPPPPASPPTPPGQTPGGGAGVGSISITSYEPAPQLPTPVAENPNTAAPVPSTAKDNNTAANSVAGNAADGTGGGGANTKLPTVRLNKSEVKLGDQLYIFGVSQANNQATIVIRSGNILNIQTNTGKNGRYSYNLDTGILAPGRYLIQTHDEKDNISPTDSFIVGTENIYNPGRIYTGGDSSGAGSGVKNHLFGDLNDDNQVNIFDFSILLYWYGQPLPSDLLYKMATKPDEKIDLSHASKLIANWTG